MEDRLGFIREKSPENIRLKEAELNRILTEADLPQCFGDPLEGDRECGLCIIRTACAEWHKLYSGAKKESDSKEKNEVKTKPKKKEQKATKEKSSGKKRKEKEEEEMPTKKKRGYVKETVLEMLTKGTTKSALEKFTEDLGYGQAKMRAVVRELKKANKLNIDGEKLKLKGE